MNCTCSRRAELSQVKSSIYAAVCSAFHMAEHLFQQQQEPTPMPIWPTNGSVLQPV